MTNRYYGIIGFSDEQETSPGVWEETIIEKYYYGNILRNSRKYDTGTQVIDTLNITNEISIISNVYLSDNLHKIKYIELNNNKWKVSNINIQYPRVILTVGGLYNG